MQNPLVPVKNFVVNHRGKIAIATSVTTVAAVVLVVRNQRITNEFLKDHDLYDEFYAEDDLA